MNAVLQWFDRKTNGEKENRKGERDYWLVISYILENMSERLHNISAQQPFVAPKDRNQWSEPQSVKAIM